MEENKEHHEHHASQEEKLPEENKPVPVTEKYKKSKPNFWAILALILGILLVASIITDGFDLTGAATLSKEEAAAKALAFINEELLQGGSRAQLVTAIDEGELYHLKLNLQGQPVDIYVTKDGELLFPQAINMEEAAQEASGSTPTAAPNLQKSDQPKVELFVMSHCPYGTQAEKGILPVVEKLGDKIDFDLKFVYYAMHGKTEVEEEMNQVCIEKEQNSKFLPYLKCFLDKGEGESCLESVGVDKAQLLACVENLDEEFKITEKLNDQSTWLSGRFPLFDVYKVENELYGIQGSPALVVNGEQVSSGRTPADYLATICGAFNEAPEECQEEMSTASYTAGFGYEEGAATEASCG